MADGSDGGSGDQSWRTNLLRQNVKNKIEEAIINSGNPTSKTVSEMENHIFLKARTKEEYLSFVARLILHVKEMNSKKPQTQQQPGMQQIVGQSSAIIGGQQSDPMSALQNMAGPQPMNDMSNGNAMHLTVGNDQILVTNPSMAMISNMSHISNVQNISQSPQQMNQNRVQNPNQMTIAGNRMLNQVMIGSNPNIVNSTRPQQVLSSNIQVQLQRHRQPNPNQMVGPSPTQDRFDGPQMTTGPIHQQQQFKGQAMVGQQFGQNPNMIVQNQGINNMAPMNQMNPSTPQMMPSPSNYAPCPSPMMPSPHNNLIRPAGSMGAPSPQNISLNTPANIMIASPGAVGPGGRPQNDEQLYLEKLRCLQKYVEPLRKMITRIDADDRYSNDKKKELDKMKNLLNILTDPSRRCPMSTLEKCEQFLEKMDFKIKTETTVPTTTSVTTTHPMPKIQDVCQPLLDVITTHIKKPLINHTLQRTFGPTVAALTSNTYRLSTSPTHKRKYEDDCDVPEVLQGEIARLDARFKVQLDSLQHFGSKTIHLICKLDDKDLPCVPPIAIRVPESYPSIPPQCSTDALEYSASVFFQDIQKKFDQNIDKLPGSFSVTALLNSWELSVRQAVSSALVLVDI